MILLSPLEGEEITAGATFTLIASATHPDPSRRISRVDCFRVTGGVTNLIGTATVGIGDRYSFLWTNVPEGRPAVFARATDDLGASSDSKSVIVVVRPQRPANDNFAFRTELTGTVVQTTGSNVSATFETGEPRHADRPGGRSVWWTWTATASGRVTVSTFGSSFDTLLGIYTGTSVTNLITVASNDDAAEFGSTSQVSFDATADTTYQIAVDGFDQREGRSF